MVDDASPVGLVIQNENRMSEERTRSFMRITTFGSIFSNHGVQFENVIGLPKEFSAQTAVYVEKRTRFPLLAEGFVLNEKLVSDYLSVIEPYLDSSKRFRIVLAELSTSLLGGTHSAKMKCEYTGYLK